MTGFGQNAANRDSGPRYPGPSEAGLRIVNWLPLSIARVSTIEDGRNECPALPIAARGFINLLLTWSVVLKRLDDYSHHTSVLRTT